MVRISYGALLRSSGVRIFSRGSLILVKLKADGSNGVHTSSCASGFFGFVFRRASSRLRKRPKGAFTSCSSHASYAMSRCSVGSPALARTISRNDVRR